MVSSVLPSLAYGNSCWSSIDLQNLGDRVVNLDLESHRASGALVPIVDHPQLAVSLAPGERASFRLDIAEETGPPECSTIPTGIHLGSSCWLSPCSRLWYPSKGGARSSKGHKT